MLRRAKDVDTFVSDLTDRLHQGDLPKPSWVRDAKFAISPEAQLAPVPAFTICQRGYEKPAVDALTREISG